MQPPHRIRVGFIPLYNNHLPSSRYRVHQFLEPLTRQGFACDCLEAPEKNLWKRLTYLPPLLKMAIKCNVLFIQKRTFPAWLLHLLSRLNPHIIFDLDDAIYLQTRRRSRVHWIVKTARWIITGNQILADYVRHLNAHVTVIPTVVDIKLYHPKDGIRHPQDARVALGWIGVNANRGDLFLLKNTFDVLADRFPGQIVLQIAASEPLKMETRMPVEYIPWTIEAGRAALQQFDIGLMPLADTEWNRGKCAFKLVQYLAAEAPAVASPVGANTDVVLDGQTGFLASNEEEWIKALSTLIQDKDLRSQMGQRGRQHVIDHYSVEAVMPLLIEVIHATSKITPRSQE